jgi:2',3'-cyclic-nucleotide 2'-phosphodiesterase (5'-nucleotidase family)
MVIRILHTNDLHGKLDEPHRKALLRWRQQADWYFDTGDAIQAGNLAIPLSPDPVWPAMAAARCTASVIGNRETHLLRSVFLRKLEGAVHPILCANLLDREGQQVLPGSLTLDWEGQHIGILGVSVAMVTTGMKTQSASQLLWNPPIASAITLVDQIANDCDAVLALTHIGIRQDQILAEQTNQIQVILGGHSHTILQDPINHKGTWIAQGGSHANYIGLYDWNPVEGTFTGGLRPFLEI